MYFSSIFYQNLFYCGIYYIKHKINIFLPFYSNKIQ